MENSREVATNQYKEFYSIARYLIYVNTVGTRLHSQQGAVTNINMDTKIDRKKMRLQRGKTFFETKTGIGRKGKWLLLKHKALYQIPTVALSLEAQGKNFFIWQKSYLLFSRYLSLHILNHLIIYQISDVMMSISERKRKHF